MGIKVKDLTKIYGDQRAIDSINFEIESGQIVGFLGPNGAGKTTTMKILTCFLAPSAGKAWLDTYSVETNPLEIRRRIGYLPEHNPLYLDMYVHEYLRFIGRLYHIPAAQLSERIAEVIEMTGLQREQHKQIGMLSKGYRQRVGLAQALIHDPEVLILDEPTTGLDPNQIIEIRNLIKQIGKEKTIIFSTHILPEVEAIADRVIIINQGKIIADEHMEDLRAGANLESVLELEFEKAGFDFGFLEDDDTIKVRAEGKKKYIVVSQADVDLRKQIFEESVRQNNPIFALQKVEKTLEDIFRNMTNP